MITTNISNDISGLSNIVELHALSTVKKWVKLIPLCKTILYSEYDKQSLFTKVANVSLDNEIARHGKNSGYKKRKTVIQFLPTIPAYEFDSNTSQWLYIFVINNRIVKIGGTRTGLKARCLSYLCGHHILERGNSGHCSNTNAYIYNTFEFYLGAGSAIEMYAYKVPQEAVNVEIFGKPHSIIPQIYHIYESICLKEYKESYHEYPILSDNCDPLYKSTNS